MQRKESKTNYLDNLNMKILCCALAVCAITVHAQLAVVVSPPKIVGQKALVQLAMKNNLKESVKSARALCFVIDEHGKVVGESTKWVVGANKIVLPPSATNTFNFVITSPSAFATTNLTANVTFDRIVLESGKVADPQKEVTITNQNN
jgi:hypothetical protein